MSGLPKELLNELHLGLAKDLLRRVNSGEATSADLSVLRQFLKDNGVDSAASHDPHMAALAAAAQHHDPDDINGRLPH